MTLVKPLLVSFSLLAFTAAGYANEGSKAASANSASAGQSSPSKQQSQQQSKQSQQSQQQGQMRTSELIGAKVRDSQGREIGEIEDVVLDLQGGRVHAAVLSFGGVMGVGEKHFAFPVSQLKPGKDKNQFTMNIDKQKLENAQGFEQGQWPAMDDEYWGRVGGQASAGATKSQGQKQKMALVRASELDGKSVQDKSGQDVGEIQDVVVDLKSGQLRNIVIDVNDGGQARVQTKALTQGTGDQLVLNMSAEQLKRQAQQSGSGNQGLRK